MRALKLSPIFDAILRQALNHRSLINTYDQSAHGFAIADWVYYDGANWAKADRDSESSLADGVVAYVDGDEFDVLSHGVFTDLSGLTSGDTYYLSSTAGAITNTLPTSGIVQIIGRALSTTSIDVQFFNGDAPVLTPGRVDIGDTISLSNSTEGGTGRLTRRTSHETHTLANAATSDTTTISIPSGARPLAVSMTVNTAVIDDGGDDTWSAAFITGATSIIVTAAAAAQNTKVNFIVPDETTTAVAQIRFTANGGNFTAGVIEIVAYYENLTSLAN